MMWLMDQDAFWQDKLKRLVGTWLDLIDETIGRHFSIIHTVKS